MLIRYKVFVYPAELVDEDVHAGMYVTVTGHARRADTPTCPGEFDMRDYYRSRNILFAMNKATVRPLKGKKAHRIEGSIEYISGRLSEGLYRVLPERDAQTAAAIILGQKRDLNESETELFREGGIAHILAISGMHINLLAMGLYEFLRRRRLSFVTSSIGSCSVICLFCLMTGMSVSAQRAMIMFMIWCLSQVLGRTSDTPSSLAAASILIFLRYPYALTDAGFLMSFGCLISLDLYAKGIGEKLKVLHAPESVRMNFAAGLSVQLGTWPIMCRFFYQITPWSVLVNLIVLPLIPVLMITGLVGSIAGMILPAIGIYTGAPCHYTVRIFEAVCQFEKKLPYSVVITGCPPIWQCAVYYLLVGLLVLGIKHKNLQRFKATSIAILLAAGSMLIVRVDPGVQAVFTDVGQGDGIVIRSGSRAYMVDCGSSTVKSVWKYKMEPMLKYYGIGRLDAVFLTHSDSDHTNGVEEMLAEYERNLMGDNAGGITIGTLAVPAVAEGMSEIVNNAILHKIPVNYLQAGDVVRDGRVRMEVLLPGTKPISTDKNENSLVMMLSGATCKVLLTGDLENKGEEELIRRYGSRLGADVLKCGHHGSKNASTPNLLTQVDPSIAIISCGLHNRYHHPAPSVLKRLRKEGIEVRRTDREGTIVLILN